MNPQSAHYSRAFVAFLRAHAKRTRAASSHRRELRDAEAWDRLATAIERELQRPAVVDGSAERTR